MNKILLLFIAFVVSSLSIVYAYCTVTGYACSLQDLRNESQLQFDEFQANLKEYFTKNPLEMNYISKGFDVQYYHQLFTFNTIV